MAPRRLAGDDDAHDFRLAPLAPAPEGSPWAVAVAVGKAVGKGRGQGPWAAGTAWPIRARPRWAAAGVLRPLRAGDVGARRRAREGRFGRLLTGGAGQWQARGWAGEDGATAKRSPSGREHGGGLERRA